MKKRLLLPLLLFAFTKSSTAQIPAALQTRLDFVLDSVCTVYNIKGASAAVLVPQYGTTAWTGTYGVSHSGTPITSDMHLGIGSNTKTFTATLLLKLQENGLLDLDDTIGNWIQNVPNVNGQITVRQLLNHTSGLYNYTNSPAFNTTIGSDPHAMWQPEDMLQFIGAPSFAPGAGWEYSNTNYVLAGMIISDILGVPYHQAIRDSVLTPVGLNNTINFPYEQSGIAIPHYWSIYLGAPYLVDASDVNYSQNAMMTISNAAGAIFSTAEDNVTFWNRLMSGHIINSTSLQEMQDCIYLNSATRYGLGVFRRSNFNGHVAYNHGGTNLGFINENIADSINGTCVSVLTNQDSVSNNILLTKVVAALHKEVLHTLDVPETSMNAPIKVYPNPAHNEINILSQEPLTMQLTDISGKKILHAELEKGSNTIPLSGTLPGLYFIQLTNKNNQSVQTSKVSVY